MCFSNLPFGVNEVFIFTFQSYELGDFFENLLFLSFLGFFLFRTFFHSLSIVSLSSMLICRIVVLFC